MKNQAEPVKKPVPKTALKMMTVRVSPEVHRALKIRAAEEGRTVAVIVEGLIRRYLVGGAS